MLVDEKSQNRVVGVVVAAGGVCLLAAGLAGLSSSWFEDQWLWVVTALQGEPPAPDWLFKLQAVGLSALLGGLIAVLVGWWAPQRRALLGSPEYRDWALAAMAMAAIVALWLPVVLVGQSAIIGGERYWWLGDDAMISMRYGRNLANGEGPVWNSAGEKVEGYSNFLWTIYMGLVHLLPIAASRTSLLVLLTNLVLAIAIIPAIVRLTRVLGGSRLVTAAALLGYVLNRNSMYWTTEGFETTLLALLFMLCLYRITKEAQLGRPSVLTPVLIAILSLVRADAIFLSALLYMLSLLLNPKRKLVLAYSALTLILPLAHEVFRVLYYGDILPNTAYLKAFGWEGKYAAGWQYVKGFLREYRFAMALAVVGALWARRRERIYVLATFLAYMAYVGYIGGDAFGNFRFFVPVLPLVLVLAFLGAESLGLGRLGDSFRTLFGRQPAQETGRGDLLLCGIAIIVLSLVSGFVYSPVQSAFTLKHLVGIAIGLGLVVASLTPLRAAGPGLLSAAVSILCLVTLPLIMQTYQASLVPAEWETGNARIGLLVQQNTPEESTVADFWAGSTLYFSERHAIDLLGKSDRYLARLPAKPGGAKPGHNKYDFDYSLGTLRPDFVIANFGLPIDEEALMQQSIGAWAFTGQLYLNRVFQDHCLPNPVPIDTWRAIFVCDWSPQLDNKDDWVDARWLSEG